MGILDHPLIAWMAPILGIWLVCQFIGLFVMFFFVDFSSLSSWTDKLTAGIYRFFGLGKMVPNMYILKQMAGYEKRIQTLEQKGGGKYKTGFFEYILYAFAFSLLIVMLLLALIFSGSIRSLEPLR